MRIDDSGGTFTTSVPTTIDGGDGDDALRGGAGDEVLLGGAGNDAADGGQGDDVALLGAGDGRFTWAPGEGSDTAEGQAGVDAMTFNGSGANEAFDVSANGQRVRFTRDVGSIVMDVDDLERIELSALGGTDRLDVHDLSGTELTRIQANLAGVLGGAAGDGVTDRVTAAASNGDDVVLVTGAAGATDVIGLPGGLALRLDRTDAAIDALALRTLAGDDLADASGLAAGVIQYSVDAGDDDDVLIGSSGADLLLGGAGDDVLIGGLGLDVLDGGPGDNILIQD